MSHFSQKTHGLRTRPAPQAIRVTLPAPSKEDIEKLAYRFWEERGGVNGSAWDDWFRAERELLRLRR